MKCKDCKMMYRPRDTGGYYVELCPRHAAADMMLGLLLEWFQTMRVEDRQGICCGSLADRTRELLGRLEPGK